MSNDDSKEVSIVAFPKSGIAYNEALYKALESQGVKVKEGVFAGRWLLKNLEKFDSVHLHWPSFFYATKKGMLSEIIAFIRFCLFLLYIKIRCRSLYWTAHNLYPHNPSSTPFLDKIARWLVILLCSKVFVHRETAAKTLIKEFPRVKSKLKIIEHGSWVDYYPKTITREKARSYFNISEDQTVYLFIGLCSKYKNVHLLTEAFEYLPNNSMLLIAGKFQDQDYYKKVIASLDKITEKKFHIEATFIPDEELQNYLLACDVVVLPYEESLTSGAAVLALGFGRPVIAPKLGYLTDIISDDCGILYHPNEIKELVSAMEKFPTRKYSECKILENAHSLTWDSACDALK
ncbi:hypothetical protein A9Q98_14310 [Thalassotalea sp. 42_200_T64]|nr:hypothetical protein A9Q98_14310 [Thalassotalea sp. 42_200_T64]